MKNVDILIEKQPHKSQNKKNKKNIGEVTITLLGYYKGGGSPKVYRGDLPYVMYITLTLP